jgi:hypothetical protein
LTKLLILGYRKFIPTEILVVGAELRKYYAHFDIVNQLYSNKNFKNEIKMVKVVKKREKICLFWVNKGK